MPSANQHYWRHFIPWGSEVITHVAFTVQLVGSKNVYAQNWVPMSKHCKFGIVYFRGVRCQSSKWCSINKVQEEHIQMIYPINMSSAITTSILSVWEQAYLHRRLSIRTPRILTLGWFLPQLWVWAKYRVRNPLLGQHAKCAYHLLYLTYLLVWTR